MEFFLGRTGNHFVSEAVGHEIIGKHKAMIPSVGRKEKLLM